MSDENRGSSPADDSTSRRDGTREGLARTAMLLWILVAVVALLEYATGPGARLWATGWVGRVEAVGGALGLGLVFLAVYQAARILRRLSTPEPASDARKDRRAEGDRARDEGGREAEEPRYKYPDPVTVRVFAWLLISTAVVVTLLLLVLASGPEPAWLPDVLAGDADRAAVTREALVTMLAAGVGSSVATILGYLKHASELRDFERSYAPWFVARPLMGVLVGLIFYFLIRGGMLATFPDLPSDGAETLDVWALAGIGSLVGLFSKHAVEKLRELFDTLFRTEEAMETDLLNRLPPELRDQVSPYVRGDQGQEAGASTARHEAAEEEEEEEGDEGEGTDENAPPGSEGETDPGGGRP